MTREICTKETFLRNVEKHQMSVLRDDGVYRHIRFAKPNDSDMYFDLITYPDGLLFTGDMGTYVFERKHDMFVFFRNGGYPRAERPDWDIKPGYWSEKLQAVCRQGPGYEEFSAEAFEARVLQYVNDYVNDLDCEDEEREEKRAEIIESLHDVLWDIDGKPEAVAYWQLSETEHSEIFADFHEARCTEYAFHYLWGCYAIVWGIELYDLYKEQLSPALAEA
jgi:hypothetical protein